MVDRRYISREMSSSGLQTPQAPPTSAQQPWEGETMTELNPDRSNISNKTRVTVAQVDETFEYLRDYGVLVCKEHGYGVRVLDDHLKRQHRTTVSERKAIAVHFKDCPIRPPAEVPLPPPLEPPFDCLGAPKRAHICDEEECDELSISRDAIRMHSNKVHN